MALSYTIMDVFTGTPFTGNPLAVVTVPPNTSLTYAQKLAITREFNLSETTFVHEPAADSDERKFDIFTPAAEIPFAGHPTIGTAAFLQSRGIQKLIAKAGPISIEDAGNGALRAAIPHNTRLHQKSLPLPDPSQFPSKDIAEVEAGAPLFAIVNGMTFALIELPSLELLAQVRSGFPEILRGLLDEGWDGGWVTRRYYYVRLGSISREGQTVHQIRTRMVKFATEDPGTGSAACALASYLSLHKLEGDSLSFQITQGVEMGRQSEILVDTAISEDKTQGRILRSVSLAGTAVLVMDGVIRSLPQAEP